MPTKTKKSSQPELKKVRIAQIVFGLNARKRFAEGPLQDLAASIKQHGLLEPVIVRKMDDGSGYQLLAGERRVRATMLNDAKTVLALVKVMTDADAKAAMLTENIQREDFAPSEEAQGFQDYMEAFDVTVDELATAMGKTVDYVNRRLSLLNLPDNLMEMVDLKQFPIGHAELITDLEPPYQQLAAGTYEKSNGLSHEKFKDVVTEIREQQTAEQSTPLFDLEAYWDEQAVTLADKPLRGKEAYVPVPTDANLPQVEWTNKDSNSQVIMNYIQALVEAGKVSEASAIGNLFTTLVHSNGMSVPAGA